MRKVAWSDDYLVGNETIDAQHREIFSIVNELIDRLNDARAEVPRAEVDAFFGRIFKHMAAHFLDEERVMRQSGYPGLRDHQHLHEGLKHNVQILRDSFDGVSEGEGLRTSVADVLFLFIHWLQQHVQQEDGRIGRHIRRMG